MNEFLQHLRDPAPGFQCFSVSDKTESLTFTARVQHEINPPASNEACSTLESLCRTDAEQIKQLYRIHNGLRLYCQLLTGQKPVPSIEFYSIGLFTEKNEEWRTWFECFDDDEMYEFQKKGTAFGEVSSSGNFFVLYRGKVFYSNHDGGDDTPLAANFMEFLSLFPKDPAKLLYDLGCYTRFADQKTPTQWIPKKYVSNVESLL